MITNIDDIMAAIERETLRYQCVDEKRAHADRKLHRPKNASAFIGAAFKLGPCLTEELIWLLANGNMFWKCRNCGLYFSYPYFWDYDVKGNMMDPGSFSRHHCTDTTVGVVELISPFEIIVSYKREVSL